MEEEFVIISKALLNDNQLSQSTPLTPEIEKAFDAGAAAHSNSQDANHTTTFGQDREEYVLQLKIEL